MSGINPALDDAVELTELLQFLDTWITNDHAQLNAPCIASSATPPTTSTGSEPITPGHLPTRRRHRRGALPTPTATRTLINLTRITGIVPMSVRQQPPAVSRAGAGAAAS
jgi:hypothetical protein